MKLPDKIKSNLPEWLSASGPEADRVISSRVRLARNLSGHKFVRIASEEELLEVYQKFSSSVVSCKELNGTTLIALDQTDELDRIFLVERHLISPDIQKQKGRRGVVINPGQSMGIMINEEDHLRLQYVQSGFNPRAAWENLNRIDDEIGSELEYAFSQRWGFLTACPTNAGTGMRVSVLIHLPALVLTKTIDKVIHGIGHLGLSVRGFYGEGTEVLGNIFQISNMTTLGKKESDIVETLEKVIQQILGYEKNACQTLLEEARPQIEDKVFRAYGILQSARLMNSNEFMSISSAVRLGISLGIIENLRLQTLNELMALLQPAHLQVSHGLEMDATERDILRARLIRERLAVKAS